MVWVLLIVAGVIGSLLLIRSFDKDVNKLAARYGADPARIKRALLELNKSNRE